MVFEKNSSINFTRMGVVTMKRVRFRGAIWGYRHRPGREFPLQNGVCYSYKRMTHFNLECGELSFAKQAPVGSCNQPPHISHTSHTAYTGMRLVEEEEEGEGEKEEKVKEEGERGREKGGEKRKMKKKDKEEGGKTRRRRRKNNMKKKKKKKTEEEEKKQYKKID